MIFTELKKITELPNQELTGKLVTLFGQVLRCHDAGKGLISFSWRDVQLMADGTLHIVTGETPLTEEIGRQNYHDFAKVVYYICTQKEDDVSMNRYKASWIEQPVLREIVKTFCSSRCCVTPLIAKLREPYVDDDTFFRDYIPSDERETHEGFGRKEPQSESTPPPVNVCTMAYQQQTPWYARWPYRFLLFFVVVDVCVICCIKCTDDESSVKTNAPTAIQRVPTVPSRNNNLEREVQRTKVLLEESRQRMEERTNQLKSMTNHPLLTPQQGSE